MKNNNISIGEFYFLKEGRNNFNISPERDSVLYFGRRELHKKLSKLIDKSFMLDYPIKMIITGVWGSGKTHTLYHLKYLLERKRRCKVILLEVGDVTKRTKFVALHRAILDNIGVDEVKSLLQGFLQQININEKIISFDSATLLKKELQSENISKAFATLTTFGQHVNSAWKWLKGSKLNSQEQNQIGVTETLEESSDMVKILKFIASLYAKVRNTKLVILIDEAEKLSGITDQDALISWENANRVMADQSNNFLSFIYAIAGREDELPDMFLHHQFRSRLGIENTIELTSLNDTQIEEFLDDLLQTIVDREKAAKTLANDDTAEEVILRYYPFDKEGYEYFVDELNRMRQCMPRDLIKIMDSLAFEGMLAQQRIFTLDFLEKVNLEIE